MPASPPLLLHGFLGSAADWDDVRARLGDSAAIDLPGHGACPLDVAPLDLDGWADWVAAQLHAPRPLVGYSLGGRVALRVALRHPERVSSLALLSASPGLSDARERAARAALDDARAEEIRTRFSAFLSRWYTADLFSASGVSPRVSMQGRALNDAESMAQVIAALSPGRAPDSWPALAALRLPVLVLNGALDAKYASVCAATAAAIPGAAHREVVGAAHAVHREVPAAVASALRTFWAERAS